MEVEGQQVGVGAHHHPHTEFSRRWQVAIALIGLAAAIMPFFVAFLGGDVNDLSVDVAVLRNDVSNLLAKLDAAQSTIDATSTEADNLRDTVASLSTLVSDQQALITSLDLATLNVTFQGLNVDAGDLTLKLNELDSQVAAVGNITARLAAVEAAAGSAGYGLIVDSRAPDENGGVGVTGAWTARPLNALPAGQEFISLSNNQVTLSAGNYSVRALSTIHRAGFAQTRLYSVTKAIDIITGTPSYSGTGQFSTRISHVVGTLSVPEATTETFEFQYIIHESQGDYSLGIAYSEAPLPVPTYAIVEIFRL